MCNKTLSLTIIFLSVLWFGTACGPSPGSRANNTNSSVGANSNSGKTSSKQTDTTPFTIGIDELMSEFENNPAATYDKYKERMMTVTGKLKSVVLSDGASNTFELQLQTANASDFSGKGRFSCFSKVSYETGNLYRSMGTKLDGLKQTNQLSTAPTVTLNGLYPNNDAILRGGPPMSIGLEPCDMLGAQK